MLAFYLTGCLVALVLHEAWMLIAYGRMNATLYRRNLNSIGLEPVLGGGDFSTPLDYNARRSLLWALFLTIPLSALLSWIDLVVVGYGALVRRGLKPLVDGAPQHLKELAWRLNATRMKPDEVRQALRELYSGVNLSIFFKDGAETIDYMYSCTEEDRRSWKPWQRRARELWLAEFGDQRRIRQPGEVGAV